MFFIDKLIQLAHADLMTQLLAGAIAATLLAGIVSGYFKAAKIQPKG